MASVIYQRGIGDYVACAPRFSATRLSRATRKQGRPHGWSVSGEYETGRLCWVSPADGHSQHVHGYVSGAWAEEIAP